MDTYVEVLVVILATVLAVNLVLGFVLLIKLIQIINHVKRLTAQAEQLIDKAEAVSEFFKKTAAPVALGRLFLNIVNKFTNKHSKKEEEDE